MAKRRKKEEDYGLGLAICLFLLCLPIAIISLCIHAVIIWIINKAQTNKAVKRIIQPPFQDAKIKTKCSRRAIKKRLSIFNKSVYDGLFSVQIRNRGELYAHEGKIKDLKEEEKDYSCIVQGSKAYKVDITLDKKDRLVDANCNCPYCYLEEKNCKHIYALLYKVKCSENRGQIITEIDKQTSGIKAMLQAAMGYLETNQSHFALSMIEDFKNCSEQYTKQITDIENGISKIQLEEELLEQLDGLLTISAEAKRKIRKIVNAEKRANVPSDNAKNNSYDSNKSEKSDNTSELQKERSNDCFYDSDFEDDYEEGDESGYEDGCEEACEDDCENDSEYDYDIGYEEPIEDDYDEELERTMRAYNLEEWQKELVRKGEYDPWNFEEDGELTEFDYYYEDDQ